MKSICVPGREPNYEVCVDMYVNKILLIKQFNFYYRKSWPSEDGIYETPRIHFEGLVDRLLRTYVSMWASPEYVHKIYVEM